MSEYLEAHVKAANKANDFANRLHRAWHEVLKNRLGKPVKYGDGKGGIHHSVRDLAPKMATDETIEHAYHWNPLEFAFNITAHEPLANGRSAARHKVKVLMGYVENGVLVGIIPPIERRTNFDADLIERWREHLGRHEREAMGYRHVLEETGFGVRDSPPLSFLD